MQNPEAQIILPQEPKRTKFRLNAKNFFITIPQCIKSDKIPGGEVDLQQWFSLIFDMTRPLWPKRAMLCLERHEDGNYHIHMLLSYEKRINCRGSTYFHKLYKENDILHQENMNIQRVRNLKDVTRYLRKGGRYITIPDQAFEESDSKKEIDSKEIAQKVMDGESMKELIETYPGYFLRNLSKVIQFRQYWQSLLHESSIPKPTQSLWKQALTNQILNLIKRKSPSTRPETITLDQVLQPALRLGQINTILKDQETVILRWLLLNLSNEQREFKSKQLWIFGPGNHLKTTLVLQLQRVFNIYFIPKHESFYDAYHNGVYDLCCIDEFRAHKKVQFVNEWSQGSAFPIPKKGSQYTKKDNPPFIILSNYSPEECYTRTDAMALNTLKLRFEVVQLERPLSLVVEILEKTVDSLCQDAEPTGKKLRQKRSRSYDIGYRDLPTPPSPPGEEFSYLRTPSPLLPLPSSFVEINKS